MARFSSTQLKGMDLNLFFSINEVSIHIATMGNLIPNNLNDSKRIADNWSYVKSLPYSIQFQLNGRYLERITKDTGYEYLYDERFGYLSDIYNTFPSMDAFDADVPVPVKLYSWSFIDMARRGFYSFAPKEVGGDEDGKIKYILISKPTEPLPNTFENLLKFEIADFNINNRDIVENEGICLFEMIKRQHPLKSV